jgi:signal transduction histidine kinase
VATNRKKDEAGTRARAPTSAASGLRLRFEPLRVPEYVAQSMREIESITRDANTVVAAFPRLIDVLSRLMPLRAVAIVRNDPRDRALVWCVKPRERALVEAEAVATAALRWFYAEDEENEDTAAFRATSSHDLGTMSMPLVDRDGTIHGLLSVATMTPLDEAMLTVVGSLAQTLSAFVARTERATRAIDDVRGKQARHTPVAAAPSTAVLAELTALLFDSLDYAGTVQHLTHIVGTQLGSTCVVDITSRSPLRIAHAPNVREAELARTITRLSEHLAHRTTGVTSTADADARRAAQGLGADWLVSAPLHHRHVVLGSLTIAGRSAHNQPFPLADAEQLARRVAAAIENGRLYESVCAEARRQADVLSTVSHDLKNPLGVILMSAECMLETIPAKTERRDPSRSRVEAIQRSAKRMNRLVGDLLDVSAIDGAALAMQPARCHVHALVEEALSSLRSLAANAGVELRDELATDLPSAWVDPDRLLQVLVNLLGNAIKFTPFGGRVTIRAHAADEMLHVSISDTGIGIDAIDLPHVFDRFWQAPARAKVGSGLGLAICKAIIELAGGRIGVESERGVGTTFRFTLPRAGHRSEVVSG